MKKSNRFKSRVGEKYITNQGYEIVIIEYFNATNITIQFEDGVIRKNINIYHLRKGNVKKPHNRLGEKHISNTGMNAIIIEYFGFENITVQFDDGTILKKRRYSDIIKGEFKNPYQLSVWNVGYYGVGKYKSKTHKKIYGVWQNMFERCYSEKFQEKHLSYKGCSVDSRWHNFQNFAEWFDKNYNPETMQGWQLDKDILFKGNRIYSPETCAFVPHEINTLIVNCKKARGKLPVGVQLCKEKFIASITIYGKLVHLGTFNTIEDAFQAYKVAKEAHIKEIADNWKEQISIKVYQAMYNWIVEITD